jgi:predicted dienelactone hydrolase
MDRVTSGKQARRWPRRTLRILLVLVLVLVVTLGGYIGYVVVRAAQPITLPTPTGPYPVGRSILDWTDHSRTDPLAPRTAMPRELSVWLWYPASPDPGAQPAPYTPGAWAGLHLGGVAGWGETSFDDVRDHALADVPVAAGRFPVAVLEPGLGFAAPQYTTVAENLASHGYLVVGVTPTYSANLTVLHGQSMAATDAGDPSAFEAANLHAGQAQVAGDRLVDIWAADARFAARQAAMLDSGGRFAGHVNTTTTVYLGHSFGGAAALEACRSDQHCVGAADLDGTQYGNVVHAGLTKPMLLVSSQNSCVTGTCQPAGSADQATRDTAHALLTASTGPVWCYQVNGAEHFNFSDYGSYYLAAPLRYLLALGTINGVAALTITDAYLTAFVDHVTQGRTEPLLTEQSSPYPQVEVQHTPS